MEPDRFQQNQKFYIIGLVCLLIGMALFGTSAYILPRVAFGLNYKIPAFIFDWTHWVRVAYGVSEKSAGWLIFGIFSLLGFLFSIVTHILSNHIDKQIYAIEEPEKTVVTVMKPNTAMKESGPLVLRMILIIACIFIITKIFHWVISAQ